MFNDELFITFLVTKCTLIQHQPNLLQAILKQYAQHTFWWFVLYFILTYTVLTININIHFWTWACFCLCTNCAVHTFLNVLCWKDVVRHCNDCQVWLNLSVTSPGKLHQLLHIKVFPYWRLSKTWQVTNVSVIIWHRSSCTTPVHLHNNCRVSCLLSVLPSVLHDNVQSWGYVKERHWKTHCNFHIYKKKSSINSCWDSHPFICTHVYCLTIFATSCSVCLNMSQPASLRLGDALLSMVGKFGEYWYWPSNQTGGVERRDRLGGWRNHNPNSGPTLYGCYLVLVQPIWGGAAWKWDGPGERLVASVGTKHRLIFASISRWALTTSQDHKK